MIDFGGSNPPLFYPGFTIKIFTSGRYIQRICFGNVNNREPILDEAPIR
jgi:hypothetical protein